LEIEIDGGVHAQPERAAYDAARTEFLQQRSIRVLRFTNEDVENDLESVLRRIVEATSPPLPTTSVPASGEGDGG
jgi:very-short-patch-repair endonuclease